MKVIDENINDTDSLKGYNIITDSQKQLSAYSANHRMTSMFSSYLVLILGVLHVNSSVSENSVWWCKSLWSLVLCSTDDIVCDDFLIDSTSTTADTGLIMYKSLLQNISIHVDLQIIHAQVHVYLLLRS